MPSSINNFELTNQLENVLKEFIKDKLELIMNNFLQFERPDLCDSKNGYYKRSLDARYGKIENLSVTLDRLGEFQNQVFEP